MADKQDPKATSQSQSSAELIQSNVQQSRVPAIATPQNGQPAISMDTILRFMATGLAPTAPRLPDQALSNQMFGGYPKGFTAVRGFKGTLSFNVLRQVAMRSPLLSAIISTRLHQITRYSTPTITTPKNQVGFRVVHRLEHDKDFKVPKEFNNLCREVEKMLEHPWKMYWGDGTIYRDVEPTMHGFLSKVTEDLLVLNRPVIELGLDPLRVPRAFGAIDGSNVIPTFAALKYLTTRVKDLPRDFVNNYDSYRRSLQILSDKYSISLDERTEYIFLNYGRPVAGFRHDELILAPMFPSTDVRQVGYPKGLTEKAIFILLSEIMAMTANSRYFEFGSMMEVLIALKGNYDDKHFKDLEQIFQGNMTGVPGMHRTPMIATPGGKDDISVIPLKQNHRDMLFDIYIQKLTNLACAVFRMHPSEINEAPRAGDNSGGLNQASQAKQINMAQEQGLENTLLHLKIHVFDPIIQRINPDMQLEWDYGQNEQEKLTINQLYAPIAKVNERRMMMGMDPLEKDDPRGEVIADAIVQGAMTPPGGPGGPGGAPGPGGPAGGGPSPGLAAIGGGESKGNEGKGKQQGANANESPADFAKRVSKISASRQGEASR